MVNNFWQGLTSVLTKWLTKSSQYIILWVVLDSAVLVFVLELRFKYELVFMLVVIELLTLLLLKCFINVLSFSSFWVLSPVPLVLFLFLSFSISLLTSEYKDELQLECTLFRSMTLNLFKFELSVFMLRDTLLNGLITASLLMLLFWLASWLTSLLWCWCCCWLF